MNDLVQRLLAAIDALEQANRVYPDYRDFHSDGWVDGATGRNLDESWHTLGCGRYFGSQAGGGDRCECGVPEAVRRRCAADRKIVEEVMSWQHQYIEGDPWYSCAQAVTNPYGNEEERAPGSGCADDARAGTACDCGLETRQRRILEPLAEGYGVEKQP
ncbi:hypothetical protein JOF41_007356 [Saccharothrix coeruleofusca]|uniref:hypothetical protein n=1 Tax=Saccharothrix coeruleofusca TaxID=33919 RepID=UPI001AE9D03B|nr:hypothetical protein [Saccharothrix coeruleofusca]MBP2341102.1 hypothetical protein [Saccharothrix coeruleofusca]